MAGLVFFCAFSALLWEGVERFFPSSVGPLVSMTNIPRSRLAFGTV